MGATPYWRSTHRNRESIWCSCMSPYLTFSLRFSFHFSFSACSTILALVLCDQPQPPSVVACWVSALFSHLYWATSLGVVWWCVLYATHSSHSSDSTLRLGGVWGGRVSVCAWMPLCAANGVGQMMLRKRLRSERSAPELHTYLLSLRKLEMLRKRLKCASLDFDILFSTT
jgi:hypothetical protein